MPAEAKEISKANIAKRLAWLNGQLAGKDYLMGAHFTVADGYLFNVTNWGAFVGFDISPYANIVALRAKIAARPAVQQAMRAEGLLK
jgi:glutathione S-transferase